MHNRSFQNIKILLWFVMKFFKHKTLYTKSHVIHSPLLLITNVNKYREFMNCSHDFAILHCNIYYDGFNCMFCKQQVTCCHCTCTMLLHLQTLVKNLQKGFPTKLSDCCIRMFYTTWLFCYGIAIFQIQFNCSSKQCCKEVLLSC